MGYSKAHQYSDVLIGICHIAKAICHPARLKIIFDLQLGRKRAVELLEGHPISISTLSQHCQILLKSEIIEATIDGKYTFYSFNKLLLPKLIKKALLELKDNTLQKFIPAPRRNLHQ